MVSDHDLEGLRGRVRRVAARQTCRVVRDGSEFVHRTAHGVMLDRAGQVTERSWEANSGAVGRTAYAYHSHRQPAEAVETGTNPDGSTWTLRRIYTYDDKGRLVEERHERADGSLVRTRRPIYAADGRRIEEQRFERRSRGSCGADSIAVDGSNDSFVVPTAARSARIMYDLRGAPVEITFKGRLGVTVGRVAFETDAAGRTTAVRNYGEAEQSVTSEATWLRLVERLFGWVAREMLNGWARWNLVRRGRWRTLGHSVLWGPLWFERFMRYDAAGHRVEERMRFAGALETIETWNYDADGRLIEHVDRDETGNVMTREDYTYEVDAVGNWVSRTIERPWRPKCPEEMIDTTVRIIDYFD